mmetsp:Transcript_215/g.723  ORF Transcript_215/g.723 Transcript_215/m.723 type:complete len:80 (+) Transcript_215:358-597(+)
MSLLCSEAVDRHCRHFRPGGGEVSNDEQVDTLNSKQSNLHAQGQYPFLRLIESRILSWGALFSDPAPRRFFARLFQSLL